MKLDYRNKWILITGASSGIGESLCRELEKQGAKIILTSRNLKKLENVRSSLANPERHIVCRVDLADQESIYDLHETLSKKNLQIDILINNGGVSQRAFALDTQSDVERSLMEVNFFGTVTLSKLFARSMLKRKAGHIVVISSVVGKFGCPLRSSYSASKHALHGYFESLRAEMASSGVKVSIVCPGYIKTQVSINALDGDGRATDVMDERTENGLTSDEFARQFVRRLGSKSEFYIGRGEVLLVYLKRFFPKLYDSLIKRLSVV